MTPKSLLRHPKVVSSLDDCASGFFSTHSFGSERSAGLEREASPALQRQGLLRLGKKQCEEAKRFDVAIIRLEQLYPLRQPELEIDRLSISKRHTRDLVQEEPENMGAWRYLFARFGRTCLESAPSPGFIGRASASPAAGSASRHKREQLN